MAIVEGSRDLFVNIGDPSARQRALFAEGCGGALRRRIPYLVLELDESTQEGEGGARGGAQGSGGSG
jgi:hypothetical protein